MTRDPITRINGLHKAALRTLVLDPDGWESRFADELEKHDSQGYSTLVGFAVGTAVRRRFSPSWATPDVIRYVADLRITLGEDATQIDPRLAEKLIRFLLGNDPFGTSPIREEDRAETLSLAVILFMALVAEAGLDESGVDELINEAAENARKFDGAVLFPRESTGSPHLEAGRDDEAGGAEERGVGQEPPRDADGGWESS